jgi:putative transposase
MGFKYKINNNQPYFLTATVVNWIDVFTRRELAYVIVDSLNYCQQEKGLILYAWCLMPSHLHLIAAADEGLLLSDIMRDFKQFTSKKIIKTINEIPESRKDWLLDKFEFAGRHNPKIKNYKFWQDGLHPIELYSASFMEQKLNYIHNNPVESGFVFEPWHYAYSSAINYSGQKGLLEVVYAD